jgi:predicted MFS family arabinose efflux permease
MIAAFLLLPTIRGSEGAIGLFALAGLACSAFFPLTIALLSKRYPADVARVSALMIAALMIGVGTGSTLIGALRAQLPLEDLYRYSIGYPIAVLLLALVALRSTRATPESHHRHAPAASVIAS